MSIQQNDQMKKNPDVKHTTVDEDTVVLGPEDNIYYRLNRVGSRIWSMLDSSELTLDEIAENLQGLYQINKEQAIHDTTSFLEMMIAKKIILTVPHGVND